MSMQRYMRGMRNATQTKTSHLLSNDEIRQIAPSIFAEEKHSSRSGRYAYLPTLEVVDSLRSEGFHPFFVAQSRSREEEKRGFTKHMIRFRHERNFSTPAGEFNEVVMVNSHDGTSSYQMMGGRFRMVCSNGLIAGEVLEEIKFPHVGVSAPDIIEGAWRVLDSFEALEQSVELMKETTLSLPEQHILANSSLARHFDMANDFRPSSGDILVPRRREDHGNDIWTVFNRIQENMTRGGIPRTINPPESGRRGTTRELTGVTATTKLNRSLWDMAEQMRMLKTAPDLEALL